MITKEQIKELTAANFSVQDYDQDPPLYFWINTGSGASSTSLEPPRRFVSKIEAWQHCYDYYTLNLSF